MPQASRHGACTPPVRHTWRANHANVSRISRTKAPTCAADVALWPAWSKLPVEDLNLDAFDEQGRFLFAEERGV